MSVSKDKNGKYKFSFTVPGHERQRGRGFKTKAEAQAVEERRRREIVSGARQVTFADAYTLYMEGTAMKARARDANERLWRQVYPSLGYLYLEEVDTSAMDALKQQLPSHLAPKSVNNYLGLVRAVLNFMRKRGRLQFIPYVPTLSVPRKHQEWYTEDERDRLLCGFFEHRPQWYLFFYLTARLGLRRGEVYAISRQQVRELPPRLVVDQAVQRGTLQRPAIIVARKNDEAYTLDLSEDVLDAVRWHERQGYSGPQFLFSKDGTFPRYLDNHVRPLKTVQQLKGLRQLSHHRVGRHSVASQAATTGQSVKIIQAQLGHRSEASTHKYAHLGSKAQLRLVESLAPKAPPHGVRAPSSQDQGTVGAPYEKGT